MRHKFQTQILSKCDPQDTKVNRKSGKSETQNCQMSDCQMVLKYLTG